MHILLVALMMFRGGAQLPGITQQMEPVECVGSIVDQVRTSPGPLEIIPVGEGSPLPADAPPHYLKVDSLLAMVYVPYDEAYAVHFDHVGETLSDSLIPCALTTQALQAVSIAPDWMREDLRWNLGLMTDENQDRYAALLLGASSPIVDEVAFQVAHLSWNILSNPNFDETILTNNAGLLYTNDETLGYVQINDYPGAGYYSTTEYTFLEGSTPVQVEIPKEIYYWYVVMPKLSDEQPLQDASVYNQFWREYLYTYADPTYPLLSTEMSTCTAIWDGVPHNTGGTIDPTQAVDKVSYWVSHTIIEAAWGNRPIQPNIIAHEHNGNCGETQDLLNAAARTCLIPSVSTMDICEDHVWVELWWDGEWHPWQPDWVDNPYIAYDDEYCPGGKDCSCIWTERNDGYTWSQDVAMYTNSCSLTVTITDSLGVPVENARVSIASEGWQTSTLYRGTWGETDRSGQISFLLGDDQDYYVSVATRLGNYPTSGYYQIIDESVTDEHYYWSWMTTSPMPQLEVTSGTPGTQSKYLLEVEYELPWDLMLGRDFFASPISYYSQHVAGGSVDFFFADPANLLLYMDGMPFIGYLVQEAQPEADVWFHTTSAQSDFFAVFSGYEHQGFATLADVTVRLWKHDGTGIPGQPGASRAGLSVEPNPFSSVAHLDITLEQPGSVTLRIYDLSGRQVREIPAGLLQSGSTRMDWDGTDDDGAALPPGMYSIRVEGAGPAICRAVMLLR
jgi:hypothetical protein